jgi:uncharacterized protein YjiS (DUF1127 family)
MIGKMMTALRKSAAASRKRRELIDLRGMEPRMLRDIGVTEGEIDEALRQLRYRF